ncbi:MAG: family 16 glycoside hydrolase [Bacteroidota bacterium]
MNGLPPHDLWFPPGSPFAPWRALALKERRGRCLPYTIAALCLFTLTVLAPDTGAGGLHVPADSSAERHSTAEERKPALPGEGWIGSGCYWDFHDSVFFAQGYSTLGRAYYEPKDFGDFTFEVRLMKLAEDGALELVFRYDENKVEGYHIYLWPHGGFGVGKLDGPMRSGPVFGPPAHFNRELNAWNNIKVIGRGERFDFFINGFHVWTARDGKFRRGKLGLGMPGDLRQLARFQIIRMSDTPEE